MTHDELMALPENGGFGERVINRGDHDWHEGMEDACETIRVPYKEPGRVMALAGKDESMMVTDYRGRSWLVGYIDGVLHRQRT